MTLQQISEGLERQAQGHSASFRGVSFASHGCWAATAAGLPRYRLQIRTCPRRHESLADRIAGWAPGRCSIGKLVSVRQAQFGEPRHKTKGPITLCSRSGSASPTSRSWVAAEGTYVRENVLKPVG